MSIIEKRGLGIKILIFIMILLLRNIIVLPQTIKFIMKKVEPKIYTYIKHQKCLKYIILYIIKSFNTLFM